MHYAIGFTHGPHVFTNRRERMIEAFKQSLQRVIIRCRHIFTWEPLELFLKAPIKKAVVMSTNIP